MSEGEPERAALPKPKQEERPTASRTVESCPECYGDDLHPPGKMPWDWDPIQTEEARQNWYCRDCGACFEDPHERASYYGSSNPGTVTLAIADPDTPIEELPELATEIVREGIPSNPWDETPGNRSPRSEEDAYE